MCSLTFAGKVVLLSIFAVAFVFPARAVEDTDTDTYQSTTDTTPGADYVGTVNGASGVYLGDGFVLTAAHVGAGTIDLDGVAYTPAGYAENIGTADLTLFQISANTTTGTLPNLPALTLAGLTNPMGSSSRSSGTSFYLMGYGGAMGKTFGVDTVNEADQTTVLENSNDVPIYTSTDFYTLNGTTSYGMNSVTNDYQLVSGDSGGGDFTDVNGNLVLIGINEVILTSDTNSSTILGSGFVQLNQYSALGIDADELAAVPEPPTWLPFLLGCLTLLGWSRWRTAPSSVAPDEGGTASGWPRRARAPLSR